MSQTGNNGSRIIRNTAFLYIRMLFLMFVSLFTSRIVLQNLGVTDFGIYNIVGGFASMFVFFQSSLSNATQRYLNIELGKNDIKGATSVFRLHRTLYIFIAIIVLILSETVGLWFVRNKLVIPADRMAAAVWVYQFAVLSCCLAILNVVYDAVIIAHENMNIYSYIGILEGCGKLAIAYAISMAANDKLIVYAFMLLLLTFCTRILYLSYCRRKYKECKFRLTLRGKEVKKTFSLISWNTVSTFIVALNDQGINLLLNLFFGPAVNAAQGISSQISRAVNNFNTNFITAVSPQITKSYASGDFDYLLGLFFRTSKYSVFLLWFFCLPLMLCIDPILEIWLTRIPEYTAAFTVWGLAYSMVNVLNYPIWMIALATGELKHYILVGNGIFFLAFPLSYVGLKAGASPVAVFQILFAVRILYIGAILLIIRRYVFFPIRLYLSKVIKPAMIVTGGSGILCLSLGRQLAPTIAGYSVLCCACVLTTAGLVWIFGTTGSEREFLHRKIRALFVS